MDDANVPCESEHSVLCSLVHRFSDYLKQRQAPLICFTSLGVQVEGWFKGELLTFLSHEVQQQRITSFDREVKTGHGRKRVDATISFSAHDRSWVELKHHHIGMQGGVSYNATWYLRDTANGILADVKKLTAINSKSQYVLILSTVNPGSADWQTAVAAFNTKFDHCVMSLTDPSDFPDTFFLGLLHVPA